MTSVDEGNAGISSFIAVTALVGLLLLYWLSSTLMKKGRTRSLTDLKSFARAYVSQTESDREGRAKSFSESKKKTCLSCVNFRYASSVFHAMIDARKIIST